MCIRDSAYTFSFVLLSKILSCESYHRSRKLDNQNGTLSGRTIAKCLFPVSYTHLFQLIKYRFDILHEIFVVNIPRSAGSPESTPTSVGTELGAPVRTNRTFYIITAFVKMCIRDSYNIYQSEYKIDKNYLLQNR